MIKELISLILIIFLLSNTSAVCNETQIDINAANLTELDNIIGIGPAYGQRIIDSRQFSSVDDLIRVNGIGNATLNKIKAQGLACVVNEETPNQKNNSEDAEIVSNQTESANNESNEVSSNTSVNNTSNKISSVTSNAVNNIPKSNTETINLAPISLNSQSIKSENNKEVLKKNLALYGIIAFCVMFGALFLLKQIGEKKKNEFR